MKYLPLLWAGLWRRPLRTVLTLLSATMAFLLFGLLQGVESGLGVATSNLHVDRLIVQNRFNPVQGLIYPQRASVADLPGVAAVSAQLTFSGSYQDLKNTVPAIVVDVGPFFSAYPEYKIAPESLDAMTKNPVGVIVGSTIAQQYGWKVGEKLPLHSSLWMHGGDGSKDWIFDIVGTYDAPDNPDRARLILINWDYHNEVRLPAAGKGRMNNMVVKLSDPKQSSAVSQAIDGLFANSATPTRTHSEQELGQSQIRQIGDLEFIVRSVVGAVFFTLLVLIGTTLLQQVRERRPELAVMKTVGFTDGQVMALVMGEALLLMLVAAVAGLAIAAAVLPLLRVIVGQVHMPIMVVGVGMAAAVLVALAAGGVPAWQARRLAIIDALAER